MSFLAPIICFSQLENKSADFIILDNGKKIFGNKVTKKGSQLFVDENVYKSKYIMFYQNELGNYAKTSLGFQKRIIDGNISVYSLSRVNPDKTVNLINSWYTKDNSFVKRAIYSNLREDLNDNSSSIDHLKTYRILNFIGLGVVASGIGITMYSLTQAFKPNGSFVIPNTIYVGLAAALTGSVVLQIAPRRVSKAINEYNNSTKSKL